MLYGEGLPLTASALLSSTASFASFCSRVATTSSPRQSIIVLPPCSPTYGGCAGGLLSSMSVDAARGFMQINFTALLSLALQRKCSLADYQEKPLIADKLVCVGGRSRCYRELMVEVNAALGGVWCFYFFMLSCVLYHLYVDF